MLDMVLWGSLGMLVYIGVGYPLLTLILGHVFRRRIAYGDGSPSLTVGAVRQAPVTHPTADRSKIGAALNRAAGILSFWTVALRVQRRTVMDGRVARLETFP